MKKKLIAIVVTLAMLVSMFSVAGAAGGEETVVAEISLEENGVIDEIVFDDATNDVMFLRATITTLEEGHEGWGFGALCENTEGWPNVIGLNAGGSLGTHVVEWSYTDILALFANGGYSTSSGVVLNLWEASYGRLDKLEIVRKQAVETEVLEVMENAAGLNGAIEFLYGYTFTEEDIVLKLTIETTQDGKSGWGFGALCENTEGWPQAIGLKASNVGTSVMSMSLKQIGDTFAEKGLDATKGIAINDWDAEDPYASVIKVELVKETVKEDVVLEEGVIYKQVAGNNVRFVQMISEEDAQTYSAVTYTVSYNGKVKATVLGDECYAAISAAGETITAPEGYVFVACVVKNVPEAFSFDLLTCDMEFTPVAAQ